MIDPNEARVLNIFSAYNIPTPTTQTPQPTQFDNSYGFLPVPN